MGRHDRARLGQETVEILKAGQYHAPSGGIVSLREQLRDCVSGTQLYQPQDVPADIAAALGPAQNLATRIEVTPESTLTAARRLAEEEAAQPPLCLNFASAKHPGGGFLGGSQAQEESLARSSGLYASLNSQQEFYNFHRRAASPLYSDRLIYSPRTPVIRDDEGELLEQPYLVSFVTSPAVNAGAVAANHVAHVPLIEPTMRRRLAGVLWVAAARGYQRLILGAWGCGVFRNDPALIARLFAEALGPGGMFAGRFAHIVFAIFARSADDQNLAAFRERLAC